MIDLKLGDCLEVLATMEDNSVDSIVTDPPSRNCIASHHEGADSMKIIDFPGNTRTCNFSFHKVKDGPNYFVCYYKGASRLLHQPLNAWRTLESAKHTETGKALKEWCLEMAGEPEVAAAKEEPVKKPTFSEESVQVWAEYDPGNLSIPQLIGEEPNDNTRMVV